MFEAELPVFAGETPGAGVRAAVRVGASPAPAGAFRGVPLLRLLGEPGSRTLVVGRVRVAVQADQPPELTLEPSSAWSEEQGWRQRDDVPEPVAEALPGTLSEPAHDIGGDAEAMAAQLAKAVAESSRNEIAKIRALRYELERQLADQLADRRERRLRPLLAELIELSIAFHRAVDTAREAVREDLWVWLSPDAGESPLHSRTLDHCRAIETETEQEAARLHSLLSSMSTVAVAQDAEAQQRFNLIAAATAAGLGLPALVLSFYGADPFMPLDTVDRAWRALAPIGAVALLAAVVALHRMPGRTKRHYGLALLLVIMLLGVLLVAGILVPGQR
ncbi:hypothetical protein [Saccharopolyspora taberi]|uniref:Uncharacterized protein n=1 Tax=Saccharopolyspora taberi TaxID=60895 RepID=A0ABN3V0K1_9PSEU